MNDQSQMMMSRSFGIWPPPPPPGTITDPMAAASFQSVRPVIFKPGAAGAGPRPMRMMSWKGKNPGSDKRKKGASATTGLAAGGGIGAGLPPSYQPPALTELQRQNRAKTRRFFPKKKLGRFGAPRNTTSFIIRSKESGGIPPLVSPLPATPAVLPTPKFSPMPERLVDMAREEFGVDAYGSMNGLIRLRSSPTTAHAGGGQTATVEEEDVDEGDGSSESDVEEHLEVERRLDHDLNRFEMVSPGMVAGGRGGGGTNVDDEDDDNQGSSAMYLLLENRMDDQDTHIARLEEENLTLKEKLFLMETEMGDLRRRLELLETKHHHHHQEDHNTNNSNKVGSKEAAAAVEGNDDDSSEKPVVDREGQEKPPEDAPMRE